MDKVKRKICIIIPTHWEAEMGGAQFQGNILVDHLRDSGMWEIFYIANWINPNYTPIGYQIIQIPGKPWTRKFGYMLDSFSLLKILDKIKPDVIYQRVGCAYTGISAYYTTRHAKSCKMIWHVANDSSFMPIGKRSLPAYILHSLDRKFLEYGIRNATKIIAQTKHQATLLRNLYGKEPAAVIPNFHRLPSSPIKKPDAPITVLWVANFKPSKRPEIFVRLAREFLGNRQVNFVMIGGPYVSDDYQSALEKDINDLSNLQYLGSRSQEEVNSAMAAAHLFVSTAAHEGFANTFIQAWLHQLPVVSLEVNPDYLLDGGFLGYSPQDYESLVTTVRYLIDAPELLQKMGKEAEQYAKATFSEENVDTLISFF